MEISEALKRAEPDTPMLAGDSSLTLKKPKVAAAVVAKGRKCEEPSCEKFSQVERAPLGFLPSFLQ
jgi:hypothetical protein